MAVVASSSHTSSSVSPFHCRFLYGVQASGFICDLLPVWYGNRSNSLPVLVVPGRASPEPTNARARCTVLSSARSGGGARAAANTGNAEDAGSSTSDGASANTSQCAACPDAVCSSVAASSGAGSSTCAGVATVACDSLAGRCSGLSGGQQKPQAPIIGLRWLQASSIQGHGCTGDQVALVPA